MTYDYKNLSLFGGGVRGCSYVGALKKIEEENINSIDRVSAVSAGAIFGLLYCLGYSSNEMKNIFLNTDFSKFLGSPGPFYTKCVYNMIVNKGLYNGKYFYKWIGDLIEEKTDNRNITFYEFAKNHKDFRVVCSNLQTGLAEVFSLETPHIKVIDAVRGSMSLPIIFTPHKVNGSLMTDGGIIRNTPIYAFDRECFVKNNGSIKFMMNPQTLGLSLKSQESIGLFRDRTSPARKKIKSFIDVGKSLLRMYINHNENSYLNSFNYNRTIFLNTLNIGPADFDLSRNQKLKLIDSGYESCGVFFDYIKNKQINPLEAQMVRNSYMKTTFNQKRV